MIQFILTCGCSGSGKTTWARETYPDYVLCDSDAIRETLFGDASYQGNNPAVFAEMLRMVKEALGAGQSTLYVATNLSSKRRANLVSELRRKFPDVHYKCVIINTSLGTCLNRNGSRERQVPPEVIRRQQRQFQVPLPYEDWDEIEIVDGEDFERDGLRNTISEEVMRDVVSFGDQHNKHHSLTLYDHMLRAVELVKENLKGLHQDEAYDLLRATANHDVGKAYTQSEDDFGVWHYYSHESVGVYTLMNLGFPLRVLQLVNYHMVPYDKKGIETWKKRCGPELWNLLERLHEADERAH